MVEKLTASRLALRTRSVKRKGLDQVELRGSGGQGIAGRDKPIQGNAERVAGRGIKGEKLTMFPKTSRLTRIKE